jgi:uncharacterized protein (DUF1697 family)
MIGRVPDVHVPAEGECLSHPADAVDGNRGKRDWKGVNRMPTYVSMLRGINVGGYKKIAMSELAALYKAAGFTNVKTYIQSGNVVFASRSTSVSRISTAIEKAIQEAFGFPVAVIIRNAEEIGKIFHRNPYLGRKGVSEDHLFVTFLSAAPAPAAIIELSVNPGKTSDEYTIAGTEIYVHCPGGYGKTILTNVFFEKRLKVSATARNWRTTRALHELTVDATGKQAGRNS